MIPISRRGFLAGTAGFLVTAAARSAVPGTGARKLVVVIARGGMDGLSVTPPIGDRAYLGLRGPIAVTNALPLDADFGFNPGLGNFARLMAAGQARFAPAVAIPVRGERSHFEAQDLLENGGGRLHAAESGWLNRALAATGAEGIAAGPDTPLVIRGPAPVGAWNPSAPVAVAPPRVTSVLQQLYGGDALLGGALAGALEVQGETQALGETGGRRANDLRGFGGAVARLMRAPGGPNVVAVSQLGFDTHQRQGANDGLLFSRLKQLDDFVGGLEAGLGGGWSDTVVVVATEFGRTARINGTGGTDHGTASTALLAGGAVRRGGLIGDWPTLAPARLFEGRDLQPTLDMRALLKGVLGEHLGLDRAVLDTQVFPDSAAIAPVRGVCA